MVASREDGSASFGGADGAEYVEAGAGLSSNNSSEEYVQIPRQIHSQYCDFAEPPHVRTLARATQVHPALFRPLTE